MKMIDLSLFNFTMRVYVKDRRCKSGERILNTYSYRSKHYQWMLEEVRDLHSGMYPIEKFRIEIDRVT
jgi:hypothetical protein